MTDSTDFNIRIRKFEQAWQSDCPPNIEDYLPPSADDIGLRSHGLMNLGAETGHRRRTSEEPSRTNTPGVRRNLLIELIAVDLEFRWCRAAANRSSSPTPTISLVLDVYVDQFEELGSLDDLPLELIGEEYLVRHRWGDHPTHSEFLQRFAGRNDALVELLSGIDREMQEEASDDSFPMPSGSSRIRPERSHDSEFVQPTGSPSTARRTVGTQFDATSTADPSAPLLYSDYLLQQQIGAGGMGKVYRSLQKSLDRSVAVKYLRKSFINQPAAVERFVEEAKLVAKLKHPGLVGVHGLGRTPIGGYFIVMDLIEGPNLARVLQDGPVPVADAVRWLAEACDAIEHAHQHGIVHCDLKPSNILLDKDGHVRVTDFGLARTITSGAIATTAGIEGTAAFMAPEQVSEYWGRVTPRTDVYGLGAVLLTLLTGSPPYQETRIADILAQVVSATPVAPLHEVYPDLPDLLDRICRRCLCKSPEDRFGSAREFATALRSLN